MDVPLATHRLDRAAALTLLGYAVVLTAVVLVAVALLEGTVLVVVVLVLLAAWLIHVALYRYAWTRWRRVTSPLGLHGDGVRGRSPFGEVLVPWEAVASAGIERRIRGRMLRVRLVPASDPQRARVTDTSGFPRVLRTIDRRGMRYSLRVLDIGEDQLRQAFVVQSGGRVQVA